MSYKNRMSRPSLFLLVLAASFLICGNSYAQGQEQAKDYVVIGLNMPLTGSYEAQGQDQLKAYKLIIDEINEKGGILGKKIVYVVKDSETKAPKSAENARELIDKEGAVMITGGSASSEAAAQIAVCKEKKVIFMAGLTHSNETTGFAIDPKTGARGAQTASRYSFRWYNNAWQSAHALAPILLEKFGKDATYYHITADYTWGWSQEQSFKELLQAAGCKTLDIERVPLGAVSYVEPLLKAKSAGPKVLILNLFGNDMVNALKQAQLIGIKNDMTIVVPLMEDNMARLAGKEVMDGVYTTVVWYWGLKDKYPGSKEFVDKFMAKYNRPPGNSAACAWVAVKEYTDAVTRAGSFEASKVIKALENHHFNLLKGEEYWRDWDHQAITSTYVMMGKGPKDSSDEWDTLSFVAEVQGEQIAHTKEQNPVTLEELQ